MSDLDLMPLEPWEMSTYYGSAYGGLSLCCGCNLEFVHEWGHWRCLFCNKIVGFDGIDWLENYLMQWTDPVDDIKIGRFYKNEYLGKYVPTLEVQEPARRITTKPRRVGFL